MASVNAVFLSDWYSETDEVLTDEIDLFDVTSGPGDLDCQIVPSGPGFEFQNNLKLFAGLLYAAQRKIIVVSPYFVPDEALLLAITTACQRGHPCRALRVGGGRPGDRLPRAAQLLRGAAARGREDLDVPEAVHPAHRSRSRSTTRSRSSARATWTCARSVSTWRSRCSCAARSSSREMRDGRGQVPRAQPRAHPRGVGEAAAAVDGARQPRAAHLRAAVRHSPGGS